MENLLLDYLTHNKKVRTSKGNLCVADLATLSVPTLSKEGALIEESIEITKSKRFGTKRRNSSKKEEEMSIIEAIIKYKEAEQAAIQNSNEKNNLLSKIALEENRRKEESFGKMSDEELAKMKEQLLKG